MDRPEFRVSYGQCVYAGQLAEEDRLKGVALHETKKEKRCKTIARLSKS